MPFFLVTKAAFLFPVMPPAGDAHPLLEPGTKFEGTKTNDQAVIKNPAINEIIQATVDGKPGFIEPESTRSVPAAIATIASPADEDLFCELTTIASRREKTDRDYLLAVAYCLSKTPAGQLKDFGKPMDPSVGPFRLTAADWREGTAKAKTLIPPQDYAALDIFDWGSQINIAAIRAAERAKTFEAAMKRLPMPHELFFFERLGLPADKLVELLLSDKQCKGAIANPKSGTYAAEIDAKGATLIKDFAKEVRDGLKTGYADSRAAVARLELFLRLFHDEDWAPWLGVARMLQSDNLQTPAVTPLQALFMSTAIGGGSRSAVFVGFCMKFSGVESVKAAVPANVGTLDAWKNWSVAAPDPAPPGAVVISGNTIGILAEPTKGNDLRVYVCTVDAAGVTSVALKTVTKDAGTVIRWFDLSAAPVATDGQATVRAPGKGDDKFVEKAPGIMVKLLASFPQLKDFHAAGILGNIGHECAGFNKFQEGAPSGHDGRGGYGWCQWTDTRRTSFENFAKNHGGVDSDEANYGYLELELKTPPEQKAIPQVQATATLDAAMRTFEKEFERAKEGQEGFPSRLRFAEIALTLHRKTLPP